MVGREVAPFLALLCVGVVLVVGARFSRLRTDQSPDSKKVRNHAKKVRKVLGWYSSTCEPLMLVLKTRLESFLAVFEPGCCVNAAVQFRSREK